MRIIPAALNINDATKYIGISRANLYRVLESGKLRPLNIGGRTLLRRTDLDALLENAAASLEAPRNPKLRAADVARDFRATSERHYQSRIKRSGAWFGL